MKNRIFIVFIIAFSFSLQSCYDFLDNGVSGDGDVISEMRTVKDFHAVEASAGLKVYVEFGGMSNEVEVVADANLHEYIRTYVEGGTLKIKTERNIRHAESKEIYVKAGKIDHLGVSSAARIVGIEQLECDDLSVNVSSAGRLELGVIAEEIDIDISSSGNAELSGEVEFLHVNVSSAGDLSARALKARDCNIDVSSAGSASIYVFGELNASASSAGNIRYEGNPEIKSINKSSAGSISGD